MTSVKVRFRQSSDAGCEGSIYYQIVHGKETRRLLTAHRVRNDEWDNCRGIVCGESGAGDREEYLLSVRREVRRDTDRLRRIIRKLDNEKMNFTAGDVVDEYHRYIREYSLCGFMGKITESLARCGKLRTSEIYRVALGSFMKFRGGNDIMLDCITADEMERYQAWLLGRGLSFNTVSFYMRVIRAVYNRAADIGEIENRRPFKHVYTGVDKTAKRALAIDHIRRIRRLDLRKWPSLDFARDMFMMSFYLRGMSFIDMAYLRKSDLRDGYVSYCRRKTCQHMSIEWTDEMQAILDKYPVNQSDYLLPIIRYRTNNDRHIYRNMSYTINRDLKRLGVEAGIGLPLTLYVARHSWASVALASGVPVNVISEGMGHESENTTRIYLASLDSSAVDRANSAIIKSL